MSWVIALLGCLALVEVRSQSLPPVGAEFAATKGAAECADLFFEGSVPTFRGGTGKPNCGTEGQCKTDEACVAFIFENFLALICEVIPKACVPKLTTVTTAAPVTAAPTTKPSTTTKAPPVTGIPTVKPVTSNVTPAPPSGPAQPPTVPPQTGTFPFQPQPSTKPPVVATPAPTPTQTQQPSSGTTPDQLCCQWAKTGECDKNVWWMRIFCDQECGTIGCNINSPPTKCKVNYNKAKCGPMQSTATGTTTTGTATPLGQLDKILSKEAKAALLAVLQSLALGGVPGGVSGGTATCKDGNSKCGGWAKAGECSKNEWWMKYNCQVSCKSCLDPNKKLPCANKWSSMKDCEFWAAVGECAKNKEWMSGNCAGSCKTCGAGATPVSLGSATSAIAGQVIILNPAAARRAVKLRRSRKRAMQRARSRSRKAAIRRMLKRRALIRRIRILRAKRRLLRRKTGNN